MGSCETLCLRWNDFECGIKQGFSQLRREESFYDVTLACGEDQIKAHKVILATYSPFFKSLLRSLPHQHPLLYLRGIRFSHLESVLSFMYQGEVRVKPEDLDEFLAVAQELKVNGLSSNQQQTSEKKAAVKREPLESGPSAGNKRIKPSLQGEVPQESVFSPFVAELQDYKEEEEDDDEGMLPCEDENGMESTTLDKVNKVNEQLDAQINKFISPKDANNKYKCLKCPYTTSKRCNVKSHIEAKHFVTNGFPCDKCGRRYKTRNSLSMHKSVVHKKELEFFSTDDL